MKPAISTSVTEDTVRTLVRYSGYSQFDDARGLAVAGSSWNDWVRYERIGGEWKVTGLAAPSGGYGIAVRCL